MQRLQEWKLLIECLKLPALLTVTGAIQANWQNLAYSLSDQTFLSLHLLLFID
jgi:hypothetical protein